MTKTSPSTRSLEASIDLPALPERVWRCLVEAEHLTNWFPLHARIEPGVDGSVWMSWGEDNWSESTKITIWEPESRLATRFDMSLGGSEPLPITHEYTLEAKGGGVTRLRIVHSGFDSQATWDDIFDASRRGWAFELRGLRHYLAHHFGTPREVVHAVRDVADADQHTWACLMRAMGAPNDLVSKVEGDRVEFAPVEGPTAEPSWEGVLHLHRPPRDLCMEIDGLNHALLRVLCDFSCSGRDTDEVNLWLSTYGLDAETRGDLRGRLEHVLQGALS